MSTVSEACPECDARLTAAGDETVCSECGLVVRTDRIDHGPEWRHFDDDGTDPRRTGAPLTRSRHDRGLSTEIGSVRQTGRKRRQWARLRRQHTRARIPTKRERNQVYAFTEIRRLAGQESLGDRVRDHACTLFREAQDANLIQGRSLEGFAAATVYVACRVAGVARTRSEVVAAAKATRSELTTAFDAMNRELGLPVGPVDPVEYVPRFVSQLGLAAAAERRARQYVEQAHDRGLVAGRNPAGVAAACVYAASLETGADCTQRDAAALADVTAVTIRNTYSKLE